MYWCSWWYLGILCNITYYKCVIINTFAYIKMATVWFSDKQNHFLSYSDICIAAIHLHRWLLNCIPLLQIYIIIIISIISIISLISISHLSNTRSNIIWHWWQNHNTYCKMGSRGTAFTMTTTNQLLGWTS